MRLIFQQLRSSLAVVVLSALAGSLGGAVSAGLIAIISESLGDSRSTSPRLLWLFIAFCVAVLITKIIAGSLMIRLSQKTMFDLHLKLCQQILAAPLRRLESIGAPRLMAALTDDVPAIAELVVKIPVLCIAVSIVIGCLVYLSWLSWMVLLTVVGVLVFGVISCNLPAMRAQHHYGLAREHEDQLLKHFRALTEGTKELKIHRARREAFLYKSLQTTAATMRRHIATGMNIYNAAGSWGNTLFFALIGLLVFLFPTGQSTDRQTLTGCVLTIMYLMGPIEIIMNQLSTIARANVALKAVDALRLSLGETGDAEVAEMQPPAKVEPFKERLELSNVSHTYHNETDGKTFTVGPVNLTFRAGELIFLVGGNGSGKTTLAKVLTGLYEPEAGEIRLDGHLIDDRNREYYRQNFSVVFNDSFLFESFLGLEPQELDARASMYLNQLQLVHKVEVKNGVLSTLDLSQGQRKRLALLTAYLENRPIYFFDEWAADQDPVFKEIFYLTLLPELKARGVTVFVISHDEKYYRVADRIIKLDYGSIVSDTATENQRPHQLSQSMS